MDVQTFGDVTGILKQISSGHPEMMDELLPLVYETLKDLAHGRLSNEYSSNTLATTGLVHETYLKLVRKPDRIDWQDRGHFYAVASRAMRQVLVNRAVARKTEKRGGSVNHISLEDALLMTETRADELIALDEALDLLQRKNPRSAQVVHLRYFGGLNEVECAKILNVSEATVSRDWRVARLWLYAFINSPDN